MEEPNDLKFTDYSESTLGHWEKLSLTQAFVSVVLPVSESGQRLSAVFTPCPLSYLPRYRIRAKLRRCSAEVVNRAKHKPNIMNRVHIDDYTGRKTSPGQHSALTRTTKCSE